MGNVWGEAALQPETPAQTFKQIPLPALQVFKAVKVEFILHVV